MLYQWYMNYKSNVEHTEYDDICILATMFILMDEYDHVATWVAWVKQIHIKMPWTSQKHRE